MSGKKELTEDIDKIDLPGEDDENISGGKKQQKSKKKKSKEERAADRRVILVVMILMVGLTIAFYLFPKIMNFNFGKIEFGRMPEVKIEAPEWKSYSRMDL